MIQLLTELQEQKNIRSNLSALRAKLKEATPEQRGQVRAFVDGHATLFFDFLACADAKTRKNAALLLGDLAWQPALEPLLAAYRQETTRFVKSAYLEAMKNLDVQQVLPELKERLAELEKEPVPEENKKHVEAEMRALRAILIQYEGIATHQFDVRQKNNHLLLVANRNHRGVVEKQTGGTAHPLGVRIQTDDLLSLLQIRTYRELLFLLPVHGLLDTDPQVAAGQVWEPMLKICRKYHKERTPFYFRVECRVKMTLEERGRFTKKLGAAMEQKSEGMLINSPTDYEVELRLYAGREGTYFPVLRFSTLPDRRFSYRKNAIAASIHPSLAALLMELAAPYLKEDAQIMDPFCGVGTMLIERDIRVPAREKYGTDIFGDAIAGARENAALAGEQINFIHRDFFDFKHGYAFDEIVTNMPVRGKMTRGELDELYQRFFEKALTILAKEAVIVLYTGEVGFVKKQLRLHREFSLLEEYCMQSKTGFYLLIIGVKQK